MGLMPNVGTGAVIQTTWGNDIRDRTVQTFTNKAELDSQWGTAPNGAQAYTITEKRQWKRVAGVWRAADDIIPGTSPSAPAGTTGTFIGTDNGAAPQIRTGSTVVTLAASAAFAFSYPTAFTVCIHSVTASAGDRVSNLGFVVPIYENCTLAGYNGQAYSPNGTLLGTGLAVRINYIAVGI